MAQEFDQDRIAQVTGDRTATDDQTLWGFKVIKKVIGADGVQEGEAAALRATMLQYGSSAAMVKAIDDFDVKSVTLPDLLKVESRGYGIKRLIYAAVLVAWADGKYSPEESAAVREVADYFKISHSNVAAIEHLIQAEQQMTQMRLALLSD